MSTVKIYKLSEQKIILYIFGVLVFFVLMGYVSFCVKIVFYFFGML